MKRSATGRAGRGVLGCKQTKRLFSEDRQGRHSGIWGAKCRSSTSEASSQAEPAKIQQLSVSIWKIRVGIFFRIRQVLTVTPDVRTGRKERGNIQAPGQSPCCRYMSML